MLLSLPKTLWYSVRLACGNAVQDCICSETQSLHSCCIYIGLRSDLLHFKVPERRRTALNRDTGCNAD